MYLLKRIVCFFIDHDSDLYYDGFHACRRCGKEWYKYRGDDE